MRRIPRGDSVWHVFSRGSRRMALFYEDQDYREFLLFLKEALIVSGCLLYSYCLMSNHYHLMLRGTQAQLSSCMRRLNLRFALYHNDRRRLSGHVFEGRYKAYPQANLRRLLWKLAYVFLNPVSAGLVDLPEDYPWSGYRSFMGGEGSPLAVDPFPFWKEVDRDPRRAREWFLQVVEEQKAFGKPSNGAAPTWSSILEDQFAWLLRRAKEREVALGDVEAETLALHWGRESGIPPRIMLRSLKGLKIDCARKRLSALRKRMTADPEFARRLEL